MQPGSTQHNNIPLWRQLWAIVMDLFKQLLPGNWPTLRFALPMMLLLLSLVAGSGSYATSLPAIGENGEPLVVVPRELVMVPREFVAVQSSPIFQHRPDSLSNQGGDLGQAQSSGSGLTQRLLNQNPNNPYAALAKRGSQFAAPGSTVTYRVELANYEAVPLQFSLIEVLPPSLAYVEGSATGGLQVSGSTLNWAGNLEPGHLDYLVDESATLPYLDLADYGVGNLCDDILALGNRCQDVVVTINLGVNDYQTHLYGQPLYELTLSSNGVVLISGQSTNQPTSAHNQYLPDGEAPSHLLAGLWRHNNLGNPETGPAGRWHVAILSGWLNGQDAFYVQWHNAPHADDPDLTVRHAIALVLGDGSNSGEIFFLYDNVSDPAGQVAAGYTIGLEDKLASRGLTWAYAPCCGDPNPPIGQPLAAGTTLRFVPTLFGGSNAYSHLLTYQVVNNASVPELVTTTIRATTDSADPMLATLWSTHYLHSRLQTFLPITPKQSEGGVP